MGIYKITKTIEATWDNVEADSIVKATLKTRDIKPDKQLVVKSHGEKVK